MKKRIILCFIIFLLFYSNCTTLLKSNLPNIEYSEPLVIKQLKYYDNSFYKGIYTEERLIIAKLNFIKDNIGLNEAFLYICKELQKNSISPLLNFHFVKLAFQTDKKKYASESIIRIDNYIIGKVRKDKEDIINLYKAAYYASLDKNRKAKRLFKKLTNINQLDESRKRDFDIEKIRIMKNVGFIDASYLIPDKDINNVYNILSSKFKARINIEKLTSYLIDIKVNYPKDFRYYKILLKSIGSTTHTVNNEKAYKKLLTLINNKEIINILESEEHIGVTKGELLLLLSIYYYINDEYKEVFKYYDMLLKNEESLILNYPDLIYEFYINTNIGEIYFKKFLENPERIGAEVFEDTVSYIEKYNSYFFLNRKLIDWEFLKTNAELDILYAEKITDYDSIIEGLLKNLIDGHTQFFIYDNNENNFSDKVENNSFSTNHKSYEFEIIKEYNIGILTLNSFSLNFEEFTKWYDNIFIQINKTKGLIIDVRNNTGGNSNIGDYIISTLINDILITKYSVKRDNPSDPLSFFPLQIDYIKPNKKMFFGEPIVILISENSASATEQFIAGLKDSSRAITVGAKTKGTSGNPSFIILKNASALNISSYVLIRLNGKILEKEGIIPDFEIKNMYEQQKKAIEYINDTT